ncbi:histidine kinase (plasmid) [Streptomyces sp. GDS52]|uniref:histidine kinase n=1 Tax=Streptomyces sp. GDS52 TaxID=3406419 RepID=UPI003FD4F982
MVGNDVDADGVPLLVITGANAGGKSTFLRSVGVAQLMMQADMFVSAYSFAADVRAWLFTHFWREEDAEMESGKLDEELSRMSGIADLVMSGAMVLFNESFAATNEREGAEIARQITRALLDSGVKVLLVAHLFDLAHSLHKKPPAEGAVFLRAQRQADGSHTSRLEVGGPLPTGFAWICIAASSKSPLRLRGFGIEPWRRVSAFGRPVPGPGVVVGLCGLSLSSPDRMSPRWCSVSAGSAVSGCRFYGGGMVVISGWRRGAGAPLGTLDVLGPVVLFVLSVAAASVIPQEHRVAVRPAAVVLAGVCCFALLWRRRHPFGVLAAALVCGVGFQVLGVRESPLVTSPVIVSVYTVAVRTDRRTTWVVASASAALLVGAGVVFGSRSWLGDNVAMVAWTALPAAVGDGVRSRRAYVAAVEERAEYAERTREQEARQRVAAERIRIARELHDVVAHHIALINAQAGVAVHLVERRPEQLVTALEGIRDTSRSALEELRVTVGLLRQSDDPRAPRDPMPGLAQVPELLASFGRVGLSVGYTRRGVAGPLAPAVDLAAYRIVQEALTNVRKHAGADHARLCLHYRPQWLTVTVEDDGCARPDRPPSGTGHGLIGMRERAASVGGKLEAAARPGGGFTVTAELPLRPGAAVVAPVGRDAGEGWA